MATPVGHVLAGLGVARLAGSAPARPERWLVPACCVLAVAPDLDFLPGMLVGQPALYHQAAGHSLAVGLLASLLAAFLLARDRRGRLRLLVAGFAAWTSHLLIDMLGPDGRPPIGVPLLWPVSDATWLAPVTLLPGVQHAATGAESRSEWLAIVFSGGNVRAILTEVVLLSPLLLAACLLRRRRLRGASHRTGRAVPALSQPGRK